MLGRYALSKLGNLSQAEKNGSGFRNVVFIVGALVVGQFLIETIKYESARKRGRKKRSDKK